MRIEDTAGNIYLKDFNCDCGLTGGCERCQTIFIPKFPICSSDFIKPKLEDIRQKSIERYGEAWQKLANM